MIQTVVSVDLPIDEKLTIKKNSLKGSGNASGADKRFSIVSGIHGDELEGQYICYEVQRRIKEGMENFSGTLDIYPALNPLGIDSVRRGIPAFDIDMNRIFPGDIDGTMPEYIAAKILADIQGSDFALDIHSSSIFIREVPQVRIPPKFKDRLFDYAKELNMDFIWMQTNSSVQENSLTYALNEIGTPCAAIDMGIGMNYTEEYSLQLVEGIFCVMKKMGMWNGKTIAPKIPLYGESGDNIVELSAKHTGFFVKKAKCGDHVKTGQLLGRIISPIAGTVTEEILSPVDGFLFTFREYPILDIGSVLGRIRKAG